MTGNGYIEGNELDGFLREFVESVNNVDSGPEVVSDAMMTELKQCFLEAYDDNKDGKIEIREVRCTWILSKMKDYLTYENWSEFNVLCIDRK